MVHLGYEPGQPVVAEQTVLVWEEDPEVRLKPAPAKASGDHSTRGVLSGVLATTRQSYQVGQLYDKPKAA